MRQHMNWPTSAQPEALFPSFSGNEDGAVPQFPPGEPAWRILDPAHPMGIKSQMSQLSGTIDCENPGFFTGGEGIIIDATATVEAGAYIIGPCYIGPTRCGSKRRIRPGVLVDLRRCRGRTRHGSEAFHLATRCQSAALQLRRRFNSWSKRQSWRWNQTEQPTK